ncbi:2Fe-2S iron-sulfur cluster-binding protein [uncultured Sulfitobacter sp.]|uniref:2Fe-2S iron-sulfur cluster-binding protein n=1 Tax=uncultured Sulfitobacter sp. TaxID=191468 RepID=UPI00260345E3|nr:2Fe-2S iron-sulfur cluster-binding protein [uncultured Sulfitobacter sp.]
MKATWTLPDGSIKTAEVAEGLNLMEAAVENDIPDIEGACGGCLSCATCHVFVDAAWAAKLGEIGTFEDAMLDATDVERTDASRLSCQIKMTAELDGILLTVPAA